MFRESKAVVTDLTDAESHRIPNFMFYLGVLGPAHEHYSVPEPPPEFNVIEREPELAGADCR